MDDRVARIPRWLLRRWAWVVAAIVALGGVAVIVDLARGGHTAPSSPASSPSPSSTSASESDLPPTASGGGSSPSPQVAVVPYGGGVPPGEVTEALGLPDALPLPADVWDRTGPGWVLAADAPFWGSGSDDGVTAAVVYLVDPEGTRYQVLELDPTHPIRIDAWEAGDTHALVEVCPEPTCQSFSASTDELLLDLTTGQAIAYPGPAPVAQLLESYPGSTRAWYTASDLLFLEHDGRFHQVTGGWALPYPNEVAAEVAASPDGQYLTLTKSEQHGSVVRWSIALANVATGEVTTFPDLDGTSCLPGGWIDAHHLRVRCSTYVDGAWYDRRYDVDLLTRSAADDPGPDVLNRPPSAESGDEVFLVDGGLWAVTHYRWSTTEDDVFLGSILMIEDADGVGTPTIRDADGRALPWVWTADAVGHTLYVEGVPDPESYTFPSNPTVVAYDVDSGAQRVLLPAAGGPFPEGADTTAAEWLYGVTSWVASR